MGMEKAVRPTSWFLLYVLVFFYAQHYFAYDYFYAEQFEFFRFSRDYALETISQWGGLASYLSAFLVQFFVIPGVGAAVAAGLFVAVAWEWRCIWKKLASSDALFLFYLLPSLWLLWVGTDFNYYWSCAIGLWIALWLLRLCLSIPSAKWRLLGMAVLFLPGYYALGPWMLLSALGVILAGLCSRHWMFGGLLLWCILGICIFHYACVVAEGRFLWTLDAYYCPKLAFPAASWYMVAVCLLNVALALGLPRGIRMRGTWAWLSPFAQCALLVFICYKGTPQFYSVQNGIAKQLDYYARTGQWQKILDLPGLRADANLMHACYQNLALAELDRLGDDLLHYRQCGSRGLVLPWNRSHASSTLLSDVYYCMGNMALAQEMAFEGMVVSKNGLTPRLLLRLVQTNLIYGYDAVAEKYIRLLEDTWAYASEASHYRQFLHHPERLEADAELGGRKRCMEKTGGVTNDHQVMENLLQIMRSNPSWRPAHQYYGAICLLNKDKEGIAYFLEKYGEAPALHPMPQAFQEAVILVHEKEEEVWSNYGVSPEVATRFKAYRQAVLATRNDRNAVRKLQREFGDTYWFYYMFMR